MGIQRLVLVCQLIGLFLLFGSPMAMAGAWLLEPGRGQAINAIAGSAASQAYNAHGQPDDPLSYGKLDGSIYLEHGLTDKWTVIGKVAFQDVSISNADGDQAYQGLGSFELSARHLLRKTDWSVLSAQATIAVHQGGENIPDAMLGLRDNAYEFRVMYGHGLSIKGRNGFAEVQLGYRWRDDSLPNEWRLDVAGGLYVSDNVQVIGQLFGLTGQGATFPIRNYESVKAQASIIYDKSYDLSYQLAAFKTVSGRNIIQEDGISAGIILRY